MSRTGVEDLYVIRGSRKLRCGYTTGSCAAAAAKAAALLLLTGQPLAEVALLTPKGIVLQLPLEHVSVQAAEGRPQTGSVSCAVRKDGGDDPDATNGVLVYAQVERTTAEEMAEKAPHAFRYPAEKDGIPYILFLDGGAGVGRVTAPGLEQCIGEAAINRVPREMIFRAVGEVCEELEFSGALRITVSIPEGKGIAEKTFNPRLGIEGGISVLGTTGIELPMSEEALLEAVRLELSVRAAAGNRVLLAVPGNMGETFAREQLGLPSSAAVLCSNFIGQTLDEAVRLGVEGILFVSHAGKLIKVAGGIMNTHSREADCRAELCAAFALRAGANAETAGRILETRTTDEAFALMEAAGVRERALALACARIRFHMQRRVGGAIRTEAVLFGSSGLLAQTAGAQEMIGALSGRAV